MNSIFSKVNYNRQLAEIPNATELTVDMLNMRFDNLRKFAKDDDPVAIMNLYLAYDRILRAIYENGGAIQEVNRKNLSREVAALSHEFDNNNRYLTYFNLLLCEIGKPLTSENLKKLYSKVENMPEFTNEFLSEDERNERKRTLLAVYSVLMQVIEQNGGVYENTNDLREVELQTIYASKDDIGALSEEKLEVLDTLNKAKLESVKRFLPTILLNPENGLITSETVENRYNEFKQLELFGPNVTFEILQEMEKVYQAIRYSVVNRRDDITIEDRKDIIDNYYGNIPKVDTTSQIILMLSKNQVISQKILEDELSKLLENANKTKNSLARYDAMIDIQVAYASIIAAIQNENGKCSKEDAIDAYNTALKRIEENRRMYLKSYSNPFQIFDRDSDSSEDEQYIEMSKKTEEKIEASGNMGNLEDIYRAAAMQKIYRELYDIIKDPIKRKEMEAVDFEVDQSSKYTDLGICDLSYLRTTSAETPIIFNNAMGDRIEVVHTGKLGFGMLRNNSGRATYSDSSTIEEYEITKTYFSRQGIDKKPKVKKFKVFSPYIQVARIRDPEFYSAYADKIFSDISLNSAIENNGGLIAGLNYVIDKTGREVPQIYFDQNALCACIDLKDGIDEYERKAEKEFYPRLVAKRLRDGALVGQSSIRVKNGYASKIMYHRNGDRPENDVIMAYEWSDVEKENDLFTRIREDDQRY